jgi:hypothetical protein
MYKSDYYRAVLLGVVIGMGFLSLFYVFLSPEENVKPVEPKGNFEVVDRYQDRCDVVRWTNNQLGEYKYFLDCSDKQN